MNTYSISDKVKKDYIKQLKLLGSERMYQKCIGRALVDSVVSNNPDIRLLQLSDEFFKLFRRTKNDEYALISKILRRSAHTVNRQLKKMDSDRSIDSRFLRAV